MAKHESEIVTLADIINGIDERSSDQWYEIMGIEIEGLTEANANGEADDFAAASEIEAAYIRQHERDTYRVSWPEHVITPRYNSDASYQLESAE